MVLKIFFFYEYINVFYFYYAWNFEKTLMKKYMCVCILIKLFYSILFQMYTTPFKQMHQILKSFQTCSISIFLFAKSLQMSRSFIPKLSDMYLSEKRDTSSYVMITKLLQITFKINSDTTVQSKKIPSWLHHFSFIFFFFFSIQSHTLHISIKSLLTPSD